jgi:hypothetical protein
LKTETFSGACSIWSYLHIDQSGGHPGTAHGYQRRLFVVGLKPAADQLAERVADIDVDGLNLADAATHESFADGGRQVARPLHYWLSCAQRYH